MAYPGSHVQLVGAVKSNPISVIFLPSMCIFSPILSLCSFTTQVLCLGVPCSTKNSLSEQFLFKGSVSDPFFTVYSCFSTSEHGQQPIQFILASLCFSEHLIPFNSIYMISQCSSFTFKSNKPFRRVL